MKKTFPVLLFLVFLLMTNRVCAQSQTTFTVIKVSGSVYSAALNRTVKRGDELTVSDKLKFNSQKAYMHVINPGMGLKTVRDILDDSPRELMGLLQAFVTNKTARASRGAAEGFEKIKSLFNHESMLILGNGRMTFDGEGPSLKSPSGVKAAFQHDGKTTEKTISDTLGFNLGKNFIFEAGTENPFPGVVVIYYENLEDRFFSPIEMLAEFTPVYVDEKPLATELKSLIDIMKASGVDVAATEAAVIEYLTGEYEAPLLPNLRDWLAQNKLMTY